MRAFAVAKPVAAMQTRVAALRSKVRRAIRNFDSRNLLHCRSHVITGPHRPALRRSSHAQRSPICGDLRRGTALIACETDRQPATNMLSTRVCGMCHPDHHTHLPRTRLLCSAMCAPLSPSSWALTWTRYGRWYSCCHIVTTSCQVAPDSKFVDLGADSLDTVRCRVLWDAWRITNITGRDHDGAGGEV